MLTQLARNPMLSPNHLWLHRNTQGYTDRVIANLSTLAGVWRSRPLCYMANRPVTKCYAAVRAQFFVASAQSRPHAPHCCAPFP